MRSHSWSRGAHAYVGESCNRHVDASGQRGGWSRFPVRQSHRQGRVEKLLDLLPAFRAYVKMSLPHAVFSGHGIAPVPVKRASMIMAG